MLSIFKKIPDLPMPILFFGLAVVLYGLFGSPTPDSFSWVEMLIGVLLVGAVGGGYAVSVATAYPFFSKERSYYAISCLIFFVLFLGGSIVGFINGIHTSDWIRDIIPLVFLFLPLFIRNDDNGINHQIALWGSAFIGVCFAVRFLITMDMPLWAIGADLGKDNMLYLSNEPCVLFASLFLPIWGMQKFLNKDNSQYGYALLAIIAGLTAVAVMGATVQRAGILFVVLGWGVFAFVHVVRSIKLFVVSAILVIWISIFFWDAIGGVLIMVLDKTVSVGDNARFDEFRNVVDAISGNWLSLLFGKGWGALVFSPAAGHVWVRYTHMMSSYFLLKTGFVGLILLAIYGWQYVTYAWRLMWKNPVLAYAVIMPLFACVTFTTGFKTIGFGLLLLVLSGRIKMGTSG